MRREGAHSIDHYFNLKNIEGATNIARYIGQNFQFNPEAKLSFTHLLGLLEAIKSLPQKIAFPINLNGMEIKAIKEFERQIESIFSDVLKNCVSVYEGAGEREPEIRLALGEQKGLKSIKSGQTYPIGFLCAQLLEQVYKDRSAASTTVTVPFFTAWEKTPSKMSFEFKVDNGDKIAAAAYSALAAAGGVSLPGGKPIVSREGNRLVFDSAAQSAGYIDKFFDLYEVKSNQEKFAGFKSDIQKGAKPSLNRTHSELLKSNIRFVVTIAEKLSIPLPSQPKVRSSSLLPLPPLPPSASAERKMRERLLINADNLKKQIYSITAENSRDFCTAIKHISQIKFTTRESLEILNFLYGQYVRTQDHRFKNDIATIATSIFSSLTIDPATLQIDLPIYTLYHFFRKNYYLSGIINNIKIILCTTPLQPVFSFILGYLDGFEDSGNLIESIIDNIYRSQGGFISHSFDLAVTQQPDDLGVCAAYAGYNGFLVPALISEDKGILDHLFASEEKHNAHHPRAELVKFFVDHAAELKQGAEDASPAQMMQLFLAEDRPFPHLMDAMVNFNQVETNTLIPVVVTDQKKLEIGYGDPIIQLNMIANIIKLLIRLGQGKPIAYSFLVYFNNQHWLSLTWIAQKGKLDLWLVADSTSEHEAWHGEISQLVKGLLYNISLLKQQIRKIIQDARLQFAFLREKFSQVTPESIGQTMALVKFWQVLSAHPQLSHFIDRADFAKVEMWRGSVQFNSSMEKIKPAIKDIDLKATASEALEFKDSTVDRDFYRAQFIESTKQAAKKHGVGPAVLKPLVKKTDSLEFKESMTGFFRTELYKTEHKPTYDVEAGEPFSKQIIALFDYIIKLCSAAGCEYNGIVRVKNSLIYFDGNHFSTLKDKDNFYRNLKWQLEVILFYFYQLQKRLNKAEGSLESKIFFNLRITEANRTLGSFLEELNALPNTTGLCPDSYTFINDIFYYLNGSNTIDQKFIASCAEILLRFGSLVARQYGGEGKEDNHIGTAVMRAAADCDFPVAALPFRDKYFSNLFEIEIHIRSWLASGFFEEFNQEVILSTMYDHFQHEFSRIQEFSELKLEPEIRSALNVKLKPFIDTGFLNLQGAPQDKNALIWVEDDNYTLNSGLREDDLEFSLRFFDYVYRQAVTSQRILPPSSLSASDMDNMMRKNHLYSLMGALLPDQKIEISVSKADILNLLKQALCLPINKSGGEFDPKLCRKKVLFCKIITDFMRREAYRLLPVEGNDLIRSMILNLQTKTEQPLFDYIFEAILISSDKTEILKSDGSIWDQVLRTKNMTNIMGFLSAFPQLTHKMLEWQTMAEDKQVSLSPVLQIIMELRTVEFKPDVLTQRVIQLQKDLDGKLSLEKLCKIISLQVSKDVAGKFFAAYISTFTHIDGLLIIAQYAPVNFDQPRCFGEKDSKPTTPLLWTLRQNRFDQFEKLLELKADPTLSLAGESCFMLALNEAYGLEIFNTLLHYLGTCSKVVDDAKLLEQYVIAADKRDSAKLMALLARIYLPTAVLAAKQEEISEKLSSILRLIAAIRQDEYEQAMVYFSKYFSKDLLSVIFCQCKPDQSQAFLKKIIDTETNIENICQSLEFYQQHVESKEYEPITFDLHSPRQGKSLLLLAMEEKKPQLISGRIKILLKHGAKITAADDKGKGLLHKALSLKAPYQQHVLQPLLNSEIKPMAAWFESSSALEKSLLVEAAGLKNCHSENFNLILARFMQADIAESRRYEILNAAQQAAVASGLEDRALEILQLIPHAQRGKEEKIGSILPLTLISPPSMPFKKAELFIQIKFPSTITAETEVVICQFAYPDGVAMAAALYYTLSKLPNRPKEAKVVQCQGNELKFPKSNLVLFKGMFNFYEFKPQKLSDLQGFADKLSGLKQEQSYTGESLKTLIGDPPPKGLALPREAKVHDVKVKQTVELASIEFPQDFDYNLESKNVIFTFATTHMASKMYLCLQDKFPELRKNQEALIFKGDKLILSFKACKSGYLDKFLYLFAADSVSSDAREEFIKKVIEAINNNHPTDDWSADWDINFQELIQKISPLPLKVSKEIIMKSSIVKKDRYELKENEIKFPDKCDFSDSQAKFIFNHASGGRMVYTIYKRLQNECKFELEFDKMVTKTVNTIQFNAIACKRGYLDKFFELFTFELQSYAAASYICHRGASAENFITMIGDTRKDKCTNAFKIIVKDMAKVRYLEEAVLPVDKAITSFYMIGA